MIALTIGINQQWRSTNRDKTSDPRRSAEHLAAFALGSFGHHDPHTAHNEIHRMNGQGEQDIAWKPRGDKIGKTLKFHHAYDVCCVITCIIRGLNWLNTTNEPFLGPVEVDPLNFTRVSQVAICGICRQPHHPRSNDETKPPSKSDWPVIKAYLPCQCKAPKVERL